VDLKRYIRSGTVVLRQSAASRMSRVPFLERSLGSFIDLILPASLRLGTDSASNRTEYLGYLLGSKGGRWVGLTNLPPSRAPAS